MTLLHVACRAATIPIISATSSSQVVRLEGQFPRRRQRTPKRRCHFLLTGDRKRKQRQLAAAASVQVLSVRHPSTRTRSRRRGKEGGESTREARTQHRAPVLEAGLVIRCYCRLHPRKRRSSTKARPTSRATNGTTPVHPSPVPANTKTAGAPMNRPRTPSPETTIRRGKAVRALQGVGPQPPRMATTPPRGKDTTRRLSRLDRNPAAACRTPTLTAARARVASHPHPPRGCRLVLFRAEGKGTGKGKERGVPTGAEQKGKGVSFARVVGGERDRPATAGWATTRH
ncbi:unnamed protein product [Ectocarpus sp. 13 AM-2016]